MNFLQILESIPLISTAVKSIADLFRSSPKVDEEQNSDAYAARRGTEAGAAAHRAGKKVSSR